MEMMLLTATSFSNDDELSIEDQVHFMFEGVLQRVFHKYEVVMSAGEMLLDFFETKQLENFLTFLVKSDENRNHAYF